MSLGVASRFAVLRIDDDVSEKKSKKNTDSKKPDSKQKNAKPAAAAPAAAGKGPAANPKAKGKTTNNQQQKKKPAATHQQWDQWQKKDEEVSNINFEDELHQAILLSKVDFEKNKKVYEERKKAAEEEKRPTKKGKKNAKPQTMSLEQFNNLNKEAEEPVDAETVANGDDGSNDEEFFKSISQETRDAMLREEALALRRRRDKDHRLSSASALPSSAEDPVALARLTDALEKKDVSIATLAAEVERLKAELLGVKSRNKKLCQILANGEMKDKAELLVELDKMHRVKDELSLEVSSLHIQLEQERSKSHALAAEPKKAQGKKRLTSDSTQ